MIIKSLLTLALSGSALCVFGYDEISQNPAANAITVLEIDGNKVNYSSLEQKLPGVLFQARTAFYQTERKALDEFVDQYLLERQAQKENLTVQQLLEKHVNNAIAKDPNDDILRVFYDGVDTKEPFEAIREKLLETIRERRIGKARTAYIQSLRNQAKVVVKLTPPRANVSLKDTPVRGAADAPVTIVEYADFECPYCQQIQPVLEKMEKEYKGKIAFAYKDVPLPMHPHAQKAAEASHCAAAQGKYWEYHDLLYSSKQLDVPQLKQAARTLSLDGAKFDACLDSGEKAELVKASLSEGTALQMQGTPSFLINGRFHSGGFTYEQVQEMIDEELAAVAGARAKVAAK